MFKPSLFMQSLALDMAENPGDYRVDEHTFDHPRSGLEIWINIGAYHIYRPTKSSLSLADRWAFRKALRKWVHASTIEKFRSVEAGTQLTMVHLGQSLIIEQPGASLGVGMFEARETDDGC